MGQLEGLLCKIQQQSFCFLTGNATTGLFVALKSLRLRNKNIAIPNSVCPHVPLAILLSGNNPIYLDITIDNLGINIAHLRSCINQIDAVIAVHAYGYVCNISEIAALCKSESLPLIEDIAVAQGATHNSLPVGSFSDISVMSFGSGKIINVGHGGAILTSNPVIFKRLCKYSSMLTNQTEYSRNIVNAFGQFHTDLYNKQYGESINSYSAFFRSKALDAGVHMICAFDRSFESSIIKGLVELKANLISRAEKAALIEATLKSSNLDGIKIFNAPAGSVYWRFNVSIDRRDALLKKMLLAGIKVSSWFPSADLFFKDDRPIISDTPISDNVGDHILNIWVNEDASADYIKVVTEEIKKHAAY